MKMAGNKVPERLIAFRVYAEGNDLLGVAEVELPSLDALTDTVSGAGVAGEVDSPVLGHYASMELKFKWRTITGDLTGLSEQRAHSFDLRGSQQAYDAASGEYSTVPVRISVKATPKTTSLGSFVVGSTTDSEGGFEVVYIKIFINGKEVLEIDKYNYIARFNGRDILAQVRKDLGLA